MNHGPSHRRTRIDWSLLVLGGGLACFLLGCNWLQPLSLVLPEPKQKVPAEFSHLSNSVAVVVWVMPETLYDYPNARIEVASYVADQLQSHVNGITCADFRKVENLIERASQSSFDPKAIGKQLNVHYVVYLELLTFAFREPHTPELIQGHIRSSVVVYDLTRSDRTAEAFELAPVEIFEPKGGPRTYGPNAMTLVRNATYTTFAGAVAKKFYDHEEEVK